MSREFPVLISGQPFFDASHYPCEGSQPHPGVHPARGWLWEVHPITDIQVCKNRRSASVRLKTERCGRPSTSCRLAVSEMKSEPDED
jgi:hypothetical protein